MLLARISERLRKVYGDRMKAVVLYGSEARDSSRPDSDIDLLVLLDRVTDYGDDLRRNLDALFPLALELGRRISAKPVDALEYETLACPLYQQARAEGIRA